MLGFALVYEGAEGVIWYEPSSEFPFFRGTVSELERKELVCHCVFG